MDGPATFQGRITTTTSPRTALALAGALGLFGATAAAQRPATPGAFAFGSTSPEEEARAPGLVRIGENGIARESDEALYAYFADDSSITAPGAT